jgi:hypothetical protein
MGDQTHPSLVSTVFFYFLQNTVYMSFEIDKISMHRLPLKNIASLRGKNVKHISLIFNKAIPTISHRMVHFCPVLQASTITSTIESTPPDPLRIGFVTPTVQRRVRYHATRPTKCSGEARSTERETLTAKWWWRSCRRRPNKRRTRNLSDQVG